jgi:hypothetical protein
VIEYIPQTSVLTCSWIQNPHAESYTGRALAPSTLWLSPHPEPLQLALAQYSHTDLTDGRLLAKSSTEPDDAPYMLIEGHQADLRALGIGREQRHSNRFHTGIERIERE